jgi:ubiquinone/menaquinone biosynthesis C-methylase UbiE
MLRALMSSWGTSFGAASVSAMRVYDDVLVPRLFVPWGRVLLDELDLVPGKALLDVACGPGSVTRLAAERVGPNGRVTGCDFSPAMLELARAKPDPRGGPQIEYLEASADDLPVAARSFDVAVCQQGLQFFPDRPAALAEMHRALRPGGSVGIAVWSKIGDSPVFSAMYDAIRMAIDNELADRYRAGPWGFPSHEDLATLLADAGFGDIRAERRTVAVVFEGGAAQFARTLAASGIAAEIAALGPDAQVELTRAFETCAAPLTLHGAIHSETVSSVAVARG